MWAAAVKFGSDTTLMFWRSARDGRVSVKTAAGRYAAQALTCGKVGLGQLRSTEELVQVVFLGDGRQACANLGRVLRRRVWISAMKLTLVETAQTHESRVGSFFRRLDFPVDDSSTESRLVDPALLRAVLALRTSVGLRATTTMSVTASAWRNGQLTYHSGG